MKSPDEFDTPDGTDHDDCCHLSFFRNPGFSGLCKSLGFPLGAGAKDVGALESLNLIKSCSPRPTISD
jgi:hypothetical protein